MEFYVHFRDDNLERLSPAKTTFLGRLSALDTAGDSHQRHWRGGRVFLAYDYVRDFLDVRMGDCRRMAGQAAMPNQHT